jgi:N-methylhydantoinase A
MSARRITVGIDVGGTFTDFFFLDEETGAFSVGKVPSTRGAEAAGVLAGIAEGGHSVATIGAIVHGTTVATNALLERTFAPAGLITTRGFRDTLEMRRRDRPTTWGLRGAFEPAISRAHRVEVNERTLADGRVETPVDLGEVRARARELLAAGVRSVALVFINAYANDANERAAARALREIWPNQHVSVSSEILPEIREFERTSTTALNAALQPIVSDYIDRLETGLTREGFDGSLLIVQSNGGVMSAAAARARPIRTALSGPAAGVIAASRIAAAAGFPNVVTGDVGGTSFDVAIIANGETERAAQTSIGFGQVIRTPMIEISTVGAGGGSIAFVDAGGILNVGPESAGAVPGPACYGRGNDRPTLTDAHVVLGRIDAERPIGGAQKLDAAAARAAIEAHVAAPLGLDVTAAADAIVRVANAKMADAIRLVSIERGHDPRHFALMPFGGGGALHAGALLRELDLMAALVPLYPGVNSALGCVLADMRYDYVQTIDTPLDALDMEALASDVRALAVEGFALLDQSSVAFEARHALVVFDMMYIGQTHTLSVPLDWRLDAPAPDIAALKLAFEARYRETRGAPQATMRLRVLNLHVGVVGVRPAFDLAALAPRTSGPVTPRATRSAYLDGAWREANVYDRLTLPPGHVIQGPAFLEQPDTTILVEPYLDARVDRLGNIILERREEPAA